MAAPRAPTPKKSLGQHFLKNQLVLDKILALAEVRPGDRVLEIGPGPGALTRALLDAGAAVVALEADPRMVAHLAQEPHPGLTVLHTDALREDFIAMAQRYGGKFKLVANLPYNISGPLTALLLRQRDAFSDMTLMYQREVAERIAALPGGRDRGILSVHAQTFCQVTMGFKIPPGAFYPPPKVDSAVIRLVVRPAPVEPIDDENFYWKLVAGCFQKRRKMLRNSLKAFAADPEPALTPAGLEGTERPEELDSATWIRLANALRRSPPP